MTVRIPGPCRFSPRFVVSCLLDLFDAHPPIRIDGNFGATNGITEMLLQFHRRDPGDGRFILHLLPVLPRAWPRGRVSGLCARGGFVVDLIWADGVLDTMRIASRLGNPVGLEYAGHCVDMCLAGGNERRLARADFRVSARTG